MQIIDAGPFLLAAGLEWEVSTTGGFRPQQIAARAKLHKARHYVEHIPQSPAQERLYGFGTAPKLPKKESRPLLSLASLIARTNNGKFAFLAPLEGGKLAFVGVLGGQPEPGSDVVGPEDEIIERLQLFVEANGIARIYYADVLGKPDFSIEKRDYVALELSPSADDLKLAKVLPVPAQVGMGLVVTGMVAVGSLAVGGFLWHKHQQEIEAEQAAAAQISPQQLYASAKLAAFAALPKYVASGLGQAMAKAMLSQDTALAGWQLARIVCSDGNVAGGMPLSGPRINGPHCVATWSPQSRSATYERFAQAWPLGNLAFDASLKSIGTSLPIDPKGLPVVSPNGRFPSAQDFLRQDGSFFQTISPLDFSVQLGQASLIGSPAAPKVPGMIDQAPWAIRGPLDLLSKLMKALPSNMAISKLTVTVNDPDDTSKSKGTIPTFEARGTLYVQAQ